VQWASDVRKEINSVYSAGKSIAFLPSDPAAATIYQAPGKMSATEPQAGSPALATMLFEQWKRLGSSGTAFRRGDPDLAFASLFFPRFLFPSLIDVFWRCLEISPAGRCSPMCCRRSFASWRGLPALS